MSSPAVALAAGPQLVLWRHKDNGEQGTEVPRVPLAAATHPAVSQAVRESPDNPVPSPERSFPMSRVLRFLVAALVVGALSAAAIGCQGFAAGSGLGAKGTGNFQAGFKG
jgi:hypothetical protein